MDLSQMLFIASTTIGAAAFAFFVVGTATFSNLRGECDDSILGAKVIALSVSIPSAIAAAGLVLKQWGL